MLSSIWVATTTGLPALRAARVICFCRPGTRSSGISTPRSPRATISASEASRMPARSARALGFSILARTPARPCTIFFSSSTSSRRCTKLSAIQSTPSSSAASRSARSLGVMADMGSRVSGMLTPLRSLISPATSTMASAKVSAFFSSRSRTFPSSISRACFCLMAWKISGCGIGTSSGVVLVSPSTSLMRSPSTSMRGPPVSLPSRIFGP